MPREIISSQEAVNYIRIKGLRLLDAVTEMSHSEITYKIPATSGQNCDHCNKSATFMHHSRDHMGQNFIELTCDDHSQPRYKEYTSE